MKRMVLACSLLITLLTISLGYQTKGEPLPQASPSLTDDLHFINSNTPASDSTCEKESRLRSTEGVTPVEFTLLNRSKITITLYWLDYEGKRVKYEEIAPDKQVKQPTYLTHPWVVTDPKGRCIRILTPPGDFVIE